MMNVFGEDGVRRHPWQWASLFMAITIAGCADRGSAQIKVVDRVDPAAAPAALMTSADAVRRKLIGTTVRQPGSEGRLALLKPGGSGVVWRAGTARAEPVAWKILNGAQAMTGVPPELWFLCLTYAPSAENPRGRDQCTQADLWQVAEGEQPPA